jgi:hypothetical protein
MWIGENLLKGTGARFINVAVKNALRRKRKSSAKPLSKAESRMTTQQPVE